MQTTVIFTKNRCHYGLGEESRAVPIMGWFRVCVCVCVYPPLCVCSSILCRLKELVFKKKCMRSTEGWGRIRS